MAPQKDQVQVNLKETLSVSDDEPGGCRPSAPCPEIQWRLKRKEAIKSIDELYSRLSFPDSTSKDCLKKVAKTYQMLVPDYYLSLIKDTLNPNDPVRMQCVPSVAEMDNPADLSEDPLAEVSMSPVPCLVHRYPDRVLLLVTGKCFMYCRHCTRKRLWKEGLPDPSLNDIQQAVSYIKMNPAIREVVVSGGDPLTLVTERLDLILESISKVPHIEVIRIGTRTPVVFPQRIDRGLCKMLQRYSNLWINVQFNHPNEITPEATRACQKLQACGIPLSNQSVLLKGINDTPEIMLELCRKLQSIRVRPYYLYQCDPVVGADHFRTSVHTGIEIMERMRGHTGGLCVPTFVVDAPHGKGKVPVGPQYVLAKSDDKLTLRNYENKVFDYDNPKG